MLWVLMSVLTVCSGLNVRFEDTQGRPMQPIHREEYVYKNVNGRMKQFVAQPGAEVPSGGKPGQGREVYVRYIHNPPKDGQLDRNEYNEDHSDHNNQRHDTNVRIDAMYPQSDEYMSTIKGDNDNDDDLYTQRNGTENQEHVDYLQNDQPILSYTSRPNKNASFENSIDTSASRTPHAPDQRSTLNQKQRNSLNSTKSRNFVNSTTRKSNESKLVQSTTERLRKYTEYIKSTKDNEVTPKATNFNRTHGKEEGDRWVWPNEDVVTPAPSTNVTFEDRASFTGDDCPKGKVRYNGVCVKGD